MIVYWEKESRMGMKCIYNREMAFSFYQRRLLSMGNARKLAGLDKWAFIEGLAERGIDRHYFEQELQEDLRVIGKSG
jgi:predicted HTH domain antitoxin